MKWFGKEVRVVLILLFFFYSLFPFVRYSWFRFLSLVLGGVGSCLLRHPY